MLGFEYDGDALGLQALMEAVGDLLGQSFLDLKAAGEPVRDPGQLGQTEDATAREVADVGDAAEGQQVVLAQRLERQVPGQDELVVALVVAERGAVNASGVSISA